MKHSIVNKMLKIGMFLCMAAVLGYMSGCSVAEDISGVNTVSEYELRSGEYFTDIGEKINVSSSIDSLYITEYSIYGDSTIKASQWRLNNIYHDNIYYASFKDDCIKFQDFKKPFCKD